MSEKLRPGALACVVLLALTRPAAAEVTPADVWQNLLDYVGALGSTPNYRIEEAPGHLAVRDMVVAYDLPFGFGFTVSLDTLDFRAEPEGRVSVQYPETATLAVRGALPGGDAFTTLWTLAQQDLRILASGVPDDVRYDWSAQALTLTYEGAPTGGTDDMADVTVRVTEPGGSVQLSVSEQIALQGDVAMGRHFLDYAYNSADWTVYGTSFSQWDAGTLKFSAVLPRDGMDLMNLAQAFRNGLSLEVEGQHSNYRTEDQEHYDGLTTSYSAREALQINEMVANADVLFVALGSEASAMTQISEPSDGFPFDLTVDSYTFRATLPWLQKDTPQDIALAATVRNLVPRDSMWDEFDPQGLLYRAPMSFDLDLGGSVINRLDWLDFDEVERTMGTGQVPLEPVEIALDALEISALGASVSGQGSARFDGFDWQGLTDAPPMEGTLNLRLRGLNAALDGLVDVGLLTDGQSSAARLGLGLLARADESGGPDSLVSDLEVTPDGQIRANGLRIK